MNDNPYQSPQVPLEPANDYLDRTLRAELASLIRRFLSEDLTAFEFDEQLMEFYGSSDSAIQYVARAVWLHYDDCDDHLVTLSKPEWDYFQRLLLLLESDRHVETVQARRWSGTQFLALFALLGFVGCALQSGWGYHLGLVAVPFGLASIVISHVRYAQPSAGPYDRILFPFTTFADLHAAYDAAQFKKSRYPRHIQTRKIRSPAMNMVYHIPFYLGWLFLSPIALAAQILPQTETDIRVIA